MSRFLSILLLVCISASARAAPHSYALDPAKTELIALTHPGGLKSASHPHVIAADKVRGSISFDSKAPESMVVDVSFPTAALKVDDNGLRKREGYEPMSDGSREAVTNSMRAEDQLDTRRFPTISFRSTSVKKLPDGLLEVRGPITIRGVEKEIALPVTLHVKDGVLTGSGTVEIRHSDFRIKPYSAALGAVKNLDPITLKLKLVGRADGSPAAAR